MGSAAQLQAASELAKLQQQAGVPDLMSVELLRSINSQQEKASLTSPSLLPAHQSNKTINSLAAMLPQTSIFPAPAAHQQHTMVRSPMKSSTPLPHQLIVESPRQEPPKVFQSQNLYAQSSRIYDKPDVPSPTQKISSSNSVNSCTSKPPPPAKYRKSSSPEIQILDLSRPPTSSSSQVPGSVRSNNSRLDVELLDLSQRRDITVSAVPKGKGRGNNEVSIRPTSSVLEGLTITPSGRSYKPGPSNGSAPPDMASLMNMPALLAAAAVTQGVPPGLASMGVGSHGGAVNPNLLPFLMGGGTAQNSTSSTPSKSPSSHPMLSVGVPSFMDPAALTAYYSSLSNTQQSQTAALAAVQQMAQLHSLGLPAPPPQPTTSLSDSMNNLGMYKNFLGVAAAANPPTPTSAASMFPGQHFLAALMGSGQSGKPKK